MARIATANERSGSELLPLLTGYGVTLDGAHQDDAAAILERLAGDPLLRPELHRELARLQYIVGYLEQAESAFGELRTLLPVPGGEPQP